MVALASKVMEELGGCVPFYLKPNLIDLEGGRYIGLILPISLANLFAGRRSAVSVAPGSVCYGGRSGGGSGSIILKSNAQGGRHGGTT